jgi:hypothetical protein
VVGGLAPKSCGIFYIYQNSPVLCMCAIVRALIAQLGERKTEDLEAPCSIHGQGTIYFFWSFKGLKSQGARRLPFVHDFVDATECDSGEMFLFLGVEAVSLQEFCCTQLPRD